MRTLRLAFAAAALFLLPAAASAGPTLQLSVGSGYQTSDPTGRQPTNVMLAPGWSLSMLRAELGLVADLGDVEGGDFELQLRPSLVFAPPLVPVYARATVAITNLLDGPRDPAYGAALGVSMGLLGANVFAEAGPMRYAIDVPNATGGTSEKAFWIVEGRVGVGYAF